MIRLDRLVPFALGIIALLILAHVVWPVIAGAFGPLTVALTP